MHSARAKGDDATGKSKGSDKGKCKGKGFGKATGQERQRPKNAKGQSKGKDAWDRLVEQEKALHEQAILFKTSCFRKNIAPEKFETVDRYFRNRKVQLAQRHAVLLETADKAARLWGNAQKKEGAINMMPKHLPPLHSVIPPRHPPVARCATEKSAASAPEPPKSKPPGHSGIPRPPPGRRRQPQCIVEEVLDDEEVVEEGDEDVVEEEAYEEGDEPLIEVIGEGDMAIIDAMVGHTDEDEQIPSPLVLLTHLPVPNHNGERSGPRRCSKWVVKKTAEEAPWRRTSLPRRI